MASHQARAQITILSGQTTGELKGNDGKKFFGMSKAVTILAPDTLPETVTVNVAHNKAPAAADYNPLQQSPGGAALTVPADRAVPLPTTAFTSLALIAGVAVAADRVFNLVGTMDATDNQYNDD